MKKSHKNRDLENKNTRINTRILNDINPEELEEVNSDEQLFLWVTSRETGRPGLRRLQGDLPLHAPLHEPGAIEYLKQLLKGRKAESINDGATQIGIATKLCLRYPHIAVFTWDDIVQIARERSSGMARGKSSQPAPPSRPAVADQVRRFREKRLDAGGEQIGITLPPEAARALNALISANAYPSKAAAVANALINEEKRVRRRLKQQDLKPGSEN